MSWGFGQSTPAFGQATPASPFGAPAANPFGQSSPAFGQPSSSAAFGGAAAFGQPRSQAAFGSSAFGASPGGSTFASGFGGSPAFGQTASAFGAPASTPAFGALASTPMFGAQSTPAFGAPTSGGFGGGFGASSAPFGTPGGTPAFGTPTGGFGAPAAGAFGAPASSGFGNPSGGLFGQQQQQPQATGTRTLPYQTTSLTDASKPTERQNFKTICAMPQYSSKSVEELRWEDYQAGVKGGQGAGGGAPTGFGQPAGTGLFGQPQGQQASPFGTPTPAFGQQATPAFAQPSSAAFSFGGTPASPFGQSSPAAFGQQSNPAFGQGSSPFGQSSSAFSFSASSSPSFSFGGASAASPFGAPASSAAFSSSGFGAFGQSQAASAFGQQASSSAFSFGGASKPTFGQSSGGMFGQASAPSLFGTPASSSAFSFGGLGQSSAAFGSATPSAFGASPGGFSFGQTPASKPPTFSFGGASSPSPFGGASSGAFTLGTPSSTSLFGQASTPAFGTGGSPFGASSAAFSFGGQSQPAQSGGMFNFSSFGTPQQQQPQGQQQGAQQLSILPLGLSTNPYGQMPPPPSIGVESRPPSAMVLPASYNRLSSSGSLRSVPRAITPRVGMTIPRRAASGLRNAAPASLADSELGAEPERLASTLFVPVSNPRRLFSREQLPSADATPSPSRGQQSGGHGSAQQQQEGDAGRGQQPAENGNADAHGHSEGGHREASPDFEGEREARQGRGKEQAVEQGRENGRNEAQENQPEDADGDADQGKGAEDPFKEYRSLLPTTRNEHYRVSPSPDELLMLLANNHGQPPPVENFTVEHKELGKIHWLVPVLPWKLDLDMVIKIGHLVVEVYPRSEGLESPEVGQGLNGQAQVTLYNAYRMDKATGQPTTDPEKIDKWERKLKRAASELGGTGAHWERRTGKWRFVVEHFSRYDFSNLDSDEEDEDVCEQPGSSRQHAGAGRAPAQRAAAATHAQKGATQAELYDDPETPHPGYTAGAVSRTPEAGEDDDGLSEQTQVGGEVSRGVSPIRGSGAGEEDDPPSDVGLAAEPSAELAAGTMHSPDLQVSLPSRLFQDPAELFEAREMLFGAGPPLSHHPGSRPSRKRRAETSPLAALSPVSPLGRPAEDMWQPQEGDEQAPRSWRSMAPPVTPGGTAAAGPLPAPPAPQRRGTSPTAAALPPQERAAAARRDRQARVEHAQQQGRLGLDLGLMLGRSTRAGWGPGGLLASVGPDGRLSLTSLDAQASPVLDGERGEGRHQGTPLALLGAERLPPAARQAEQWVQQAYVARQRERLEKQLKLHLARSGPLSAQGSAADVSQWHLQCDRERGLQQLWQAHKRLREQALAMAGLASIERMVLQHEGSTCHLMHLLFSEVNHAGLLCDDRAQQASDEELANIAEVPVMQRRALLSRWLEAQAQHHLQPESLRALEAVPRIARLLTGHELAAATVTAASSGNIRLATLLAQAGSSSAHKRDLEEQLAAWQHHRLHERMDPELVAVYRLLAGGVQDVTPGLQLDWRRALGLHLWYGQSPAAPQVDALQAYADALNMHSPQCAPLPHPAWREGHPHTASVAPQVQDAHDVDFELLQLQSRVSLSWREGRDGMEAATNSAAGQLGAGQLSRLLHTAGMTPDPLDHAFMWQLMTALVAIGELPVTADDGQPYQQVLQVAASFVSQLESLKLPQWAVYVALHLPHSPQHAGLRRQVVRELLFRHVREWEQQPELQDFLQRELGIPAVWLAEASAQLALYNQDAAGLLEQRLAAQQWREAHEVLCCHLAPRLFLAGRGSLHSPQQRQLQQWLAKLQQQQPQAGSAVGRDAWDAGAGLYLSFMEAAQKQPSLSRQRHHQAAQPQLQELVQLSHRLQAAQGRLQAQAQVAVRATLGQPTLNLTLQQAVLARMSADLAGWSMSETSEKAALQGPAQQRQQLLMATEQVASWQSLDSGQRMHSLHTAAQRLASSITF